jgi:hypothetical protein
MYNKIVQRRRLQALGFLWKGGGTCRYCSNDNFDKRQLQSFDPNWFKNIYAPELQNILRNAITSTMAPKYVGASGKWTASACHGHRSCVESDLNSTVRTMVCPWETCVNDY